jgi:hypothetical protein
MDYVTTVTNTRPRFFWIIFHPLLNKPELTAAAANIILTCWIEHTSRVAMVH